MFSQSIAQHVVHVQGHKVKVQTAITPPRIARLSSKFHHGTADTVQMFKVKGQGHTCKHVKISKSTFSRHIKHHDISYTLGLSISHITDDLRVAPASIIIGRPVTKNADTKVDLV